MARKKRPRRRMVYSTTFGFHDGSVIGCGPDRKPSKRRVQADGIHIDADGVFREITYSPTYWHSWSDEQRAKAVGILAIRLNTRRAIRELVLPELAALNEVLLEIEKRLTRIEKALSSEKRSAPTP